VTCEDEVALRVPVKLGPRSFLYDVAFTGAKSIPEKRLLEAAGLTLGAPVSVAKVEEALRHLSDLYREEGYAYVSVSYELEPSVDHSRVRVRFDVVEGEQVLVEDIVVEGNELTRSSVILRRSALVVGEPYRLSDARATQEQVATLGVFASVDVSLEAPHAPRRRKRVIIRVAERLPQYIELRPGISTGEGFRLAAEYGNRNAFESAISFSNRLQLSYLPDFLIFDSSVRANFQPLQTGERIVARLTSSLGLPDIGLGPRFRATIDALVAQDLQPGFLLRRAALGGTLYFRASKQVIFSLGQTGEFNDARLLGSPDQQAALQTQAATNPYLARLLRVPEGPSVVSSQKLNMTWDRRDNAFSARSGTYVALGVEHVDSYALPFGSADNITRFDGHFFRLTATLAGYVPITGRLTLAMQVRAGTNVHLYPRTVSATYPDRLFFLGGPDSMRGFLVDRVLPADLDYATSNGVYPGIRGGDLMLNPRVELRIPLTGSFETVVFCDVGHVWVDPASIALFGGPVPFSLRSDVGTGIRWMSPVGVPLVFDVGFPLDRRPWEPQVAPQFAMGLF
jgi:outer membrane protein assembly factor BamA